MSRVKKVLLGTVVLLVVLVAAVFLFSERLVRSGIEGAGTKALGVETTLKDVDLGLLRGRIALQQLAIGNPEGFESPQLLSLDKGVVSAKLGSLLSDEIVVREIELASPEITLEQKGLETNLTRLLKDMKKRKKTEEQPRPKEEKKGKGKTLRIDRILVSDPKVQVRLAGKDVAALPLPTIELTDVSNADGTPLMLGDVFVQVLKAVLKSSIENGKGVIPADLLGSLNEQLASLQDIGGKIIESGAAVLKETESALKGAAKGVTEGAKSLGDATKETLDKGAGSAKKALEGLKKVIPGKK